MFPWRSLIKWRTASSWILIHLNPLNYLRNSPSRTTILKSSLSYFNEARCWQVACRDYPHSRHLCAKYPFNKTPHEDYCEQCFCYVCDTIAPCKSWKKPGGGHCDATEHEELWKYLRRQNKPVPPPPNTLKAAVSS
ncbi:uncharacterized protein LOC122057066 isoform X2 [Macadamia integrifolia]|uniref:uncharacterized protein LOC122057066 isoform X2 n=1 Tax=Macadamia integrifolia TaxID=60698 RepID=UPI001C532996|nr:uncharacterized protein LOC122057066 isoform X2 [Macadamia integrifolia]